MIHVSVAVPFGEAHAVERQAHQALARCRVRNGWFETAPVATVAAVYKAAGPWIGQTARQRQAVATRSADCELALFAFEPGASVPNSLTAEALLSAFGSAASPLRPCVAVLALFRGDGR